MRDNRRSAKQPRQLPPWVSIFLLVLIIIGVVIGMRTVVKAFEQKAHLVSDRGGITPRLTNDTFYEEREL